MNFQNVCKLVFCPRVASAFKITILAFQDEQVADYFDGVKGASFAVDVDGVFSAFGKGEAAFAVYLFGKHDEEGAVSSFR